MGLKAGALLWSRKKLTLDPGVNPATDTGLRQVLQNFGDMSIDEPRINQFVGSDGSTIGSRIQVIPLVPTSNWANVAHSEAFLAADGSIRVIFTNNGPNPVTINVLFWNPHSLIGPGDADVQSP